MRLFFSRYALEMIGDRYPVIEAQIRNELGDLSGGELMGAFMHAVTIGGEDDVTKREVFLCSGNPKQNDGRIDVVYGHMVHLMTIPDDHPVEKMRGYKVSAPQAYDIEGNNEFVESPRTS